MREAVAVRERRARLHQHADRRGRRVPDAHRLVLQQPVPALGVEVRLVDQALDAVQQRRDDAVGRARHPAGIGGAPEHVVGMQVERVATGREVREHGAVDVDRALGRARRAAGEVQQRHVLGRRPLHLERVRSARHQRREVVRALDLRRAAVVADQQHVLEARQRVHDRRDLAPVQRLGRHEHPPFADCEARADRLGAERGEQRRDHRPVLERAERRHVEFRNAPAQDEQPVALADAQAAQHVAEAVGLLRQLGIREIAPHPRAADEPEGDAIAAMRGDMPVNRRVADVDAAAGKLPKLVGDRLPREARPDRIVIGHVGRGAQIRNRLADHRGAHRKPPRTLTPRSRSAWRYGSVWTSAFPQP